MDEAPVLRLDIQRAYYPLVGPARSAKKNAARCQDIPALSNLSIRLSAGEQLVLRGPSGCGKTTLLKIAAGLHRDFTGARQVRKNTRIGYMPQDSCLLPWLTVEKNIIGFARAAGLSLSPSRAADLCRRMGLEGLCGRYPSQLSGGQYRRVMLARTLSLSPGLLLLDEPFTGLDAAARSLVAGLLEEYLEQTNAVLLLVTHLDRPEQTEGTDWKTAPLGPGRELTL